MHFRIAGIKLIMTLMMIMLLIIMTAYNVFADNLQAYFPNEIEYKLIHLYLQEKETADSRHVHCDYEYVLDFLQQAMQAHEINILNYNTKDSLVVLSPILEDKKLIVVETIKIKYYVDRTTGLISERPDVDVISEFIRFKQCINTYNSLLNFWFEKNGEILRTKLDFEKEKTRLQDPILTRLFNEN